jgi:hypothetical protein
LGKKLFAIIDSLTSEDREAVLIIDDSPYDRSRSKWVELLSRVWDHSTGRYLKGLRILTISWSDGNCCLPLDFALMSSGDPKKRLCESQSAWTNAVAPISAGTVCEKTAADFIDAIMETALQFGGLSKSNLDSR